MTRRRLLSASLAAILLSGFGTFGQAQEATDVVGVEEMVLGSTDAPVEVIEYASFTCPHCATFHENSFGQLKANYIDTGKIRFVYREVYFDRPGLWASMVARCGGNQDRFFAIVGKLYSEQRDWLGTGDPAVIADNLRTIGKVAGLPEAELDQCLQDGAFAQSLVDWYSTNAEEDDIKSTPSFVIDGEKYGNMSYNDFAALLDEKLAGE